MKGKILKSFRLQATKEAEELRLQATKEAKEA